MYLHLKYNFIKAHGRTAAAAAAATTVTFQSSPTGYLTFQNTHTHLHTYLHALIEALEMRGTERI